MLEKDSQEEDWRERERSFETKVLVLGKKTGEGGGRNKREKTFRGVSQGRGRRIRVRLAM